MKYSKDGKVCFDESKHTYFLGEKKLTSVTQYISQFKTFFDSDKIAGSYAKKHKLKKEDVLKMWSDKGKKSCEMGTFVHKIFEDYILDKPIDFNDKYPKSYVAQKFINDYFDTGKLTPVETEYIVYGNDLAGQVDCIAKNRDGEYFILDWKTNNEIKFENRWQNMSGLYSHLEDCNFNHYKIQLETYKSLCKEYDIKGCFIVHLDDYHYNIIKTD